MHEPLLRRAGALSDAYPPQESAMVEILRKLHWEKNTLDLESRLLKTSTRKNTLDSIRFKLKSRTKPLNLSGFPFDLSLNPIESRVLFLVNVFKSLDSRSNVFFIPVNSDHKSYKNGDIIEKNKRFWRAEKCKN